MSHLRSAAISRRLISISSSNHATPAAAPAKPAAAPLPRSQMPGDPMFEVYVEGGLRGMEQTSSALLAISKQFGAVKEVNVHRNPKTPLHVKDRFYITLMEPPSSEISWPWKGTIQIPPLPHPDDKGGSSLASLQPQLSDISQIISDGFSPSSKTPSINPARATPKLSLSAPSTPKSSTSSEVNHHKVSYSVKVSLKPLANNLSTAFKRPHEFIYPHSLQRPDFVPIELNADKSREELRSYEESLWLNGLEQFTGYSSGLYPLRNAIGKRVRPGYQLPILQKPVHAVTKKPKAPASLVEEVKNVVPPLPSSTRDKATPTTLVSSTGKSQSNSSTLAPSTPSPPQIKLKKKRTSLTKNSRLTHPPSSKSGSLSAEAAAALAREEAEAAERRVEEHLTAAMMNKTTSHDAIEDIRKAVEESEHLPSHLPPLPKAEVEMMEDPLRRLEGHDLQRAALNPSLFDRDEMEHPHQSVSDAHDAVGASVGEVMGEKKAERVDELGSDLVGDVKEALFAAKEERGVEVEVKKEEKEAKEKQESAGLLGGFSQWFKK